MGRGWEDEGMSAPVVLIAGAGQDASAWDETIALLASPQAIAFSPFEL